jgi:hypothetical protein
MLGGQVQFNQWFGGRWRRHPMRWFGTVSTMALLLPVAIASDDGARAVVEKAIQAQGGADKVSKLRIMRIKVEGTTSLVPGQPALPFVLEDCWQMPNQYKTTSEFEFAGKKVKQTQAIDGEKGWMQLDGAAQDMPKEAVAEMREQKYAEDLDRLGFLKDKGIHLTGLGESKVGGRAAAGVLIKAKGHRDVKLWFDKESGLLVKRENKVLDAGTGKEATQEVVFGDYRETGGVTHYRAVTAYRDGKKIIEAKVREIEFFGKLDNKVFAKP